MNRADAKEQRRAVVDIGSNTVRLVVYGEPARAPSTWVNEKVVARLGRDLEATGEIPEEGFDIALPALQRYAMILDNLRMESVEVVATAAVRDAANGPAFVDRAANAGLVPRVLTGEEEARASAMGVLGAFPDAHGVVCDLGGGSLELVSVAGGDSHDGHSLPLGTLRLPALRDHGEQAFDERVRSCIGEAGWAGRHPGPLYMVGGTWRAFAAWAMQKLDYPIDDPHGFELPVEQARDFAKAVAAEAPDTLADLSGVASSRSEALPHAAALLAIMLEELDPDSLVFSSWGLREGVLFEQLDPLVRAQDPFLVGTTHFAASRGVDPGTATQVAAWCVAASGGGAPGEERLRIGATKLALANARVEPNWRARHALDWALNKRWIGLDMAGRGQLAAALWASCGNSDFPPGVERLADEAALRRAAGWGLATRLHRRLGGGSKLALKVTRLLREEDSLVLEVEEGSAALVGPQGESDLSILADWLGLAPQVRTVANAD